MSDNIGYHVTQIEPGVYGEASKIKEEFEEFWDASLTQGCRVMELVELSDLIGAIEAYVDKSYGLKLQDLIKFSDITKRAFNNGRRSPKDTKEPIKTSSKARLVVVKKTPNGNYIATDFNDSSVVGLALEYDGMQEIVLRNNWLVVSEE